LKEDEGGAVSLRECIGIRPRLGVATWGVCRAFSGRSAERVHDPPLPLWRLRSVYVVGALTAFFAITIVSLAFARTTHHYESVITEVPAEGPGGPVPAPGPLEEVNAITVFSGDLYVAEHLSGEQGINGHQFRADQFAPSVSKPGSYEFVAQLPPHPVVIPRGVAFGTAGSESEMYISQGPLASGVNVFATGSCGNLGCATFQTFWTGAEVSEHGPFVGVGGVAVDHSTSPGDWASGDVFVADGGSDVVDIFEPIAGGAEKYRGQVTGGGPVAVSGFNGDLIVGSQVFRPEQEGLPKEGKYAFACNLVGPGGPLEGIAAVAVDDSTVGTFAGEIYVSTSQGVYEFGPECGFRGSIAGVPREGTPGGAKGQTEEMPLISPNLAVDSTEHKVFVGIVGAVDVFGPDVIVPDVVTEAPSNLVLETDTETGGVSWGINPTGNVNPLNEGVASCGFAWGLTEAFGREARCSEEPVPNGPSPVPVHARLTGLQPDTSYSYRLHAKNEHGANPSEAAETYGFTTPGPRLANESVSDVSSTSATFEATITPHDEPNYPAKLEGSERAQDLQAPTKTPTSYFFQYNTTGTAACTAKPAACTSVPSSPASVGLATGDVNVSQPALGLTANTTYHYRLVAGHEALPATRPGVLIPFYGPDRTFTTQSVGAPFVLPDGRAWQLVSPADKHGATIPVAAAGQAAAGGGQFTFLTAAKPTEPNAPSSLQYPRVLSTRVAPGLWSSSDISLSRSQPQEVKVGETHDEYRFFSEDFSLSVAATEGAFSVPEGWHLNERGEWERFVEASPVPTEPTSYLRHDATCSAMPATCYEPLLDSEDVTSGEKYEDTGFAGATPDGAHMFISSRVQLTTTPAPHGGLYEWSAARPPAQRLSLVNVGPHGEELPETIAAVAADGSRIVLGNYVRDSASGETLQLGGSFVGASADLTKLFYTVGGGLSLCELATTPLKCAVTDLTPTPGPGQPGFGEHTEVQSSLGISADGASIYFLAQGVLVAGAKPGALNLYVAHEREGKWSTTFIASPQPVGEAPAVGEEHRVSPSGRWLAFSSHSPLTAYDNRDAKTGLRDSEVYLYDAESTGLACASCDPTGARPTGESVVPNTQYAQALAAPSRVVFDTGRLFFDSADALVPQDVNGNTDVYEYEPTGVGSCTAASAASDAATGGCVALISSGLASGESVFLDASSTGSDAFFTTAERLVPQDVDNLLDVYDAHECTAASPCPASSILPPPCTTEASCIAPPSPQPSIFGPPSSATFSGPGNLAPASPVKKVTKKTAKCKKHLVKNKKGKCVKPKKPKKAKKTSRRASR
jgi:hypothetical protein